MTYCIFYSYIVISTYHKNQDSKLFDFISKWNELRNLEYNNKTLKKNNIKSNFDWDLISWLKKFTADEIYPDYEWDKWNEISNCIMKTSMSKLPKYLIIQLMRFQSDNSYVRSVLIKNEQFIEFPINGLDISNFYNGNPSEISWVYDLYGVIYRTGTMGFGSYYTSIRSNVNEDNWHMFNGKFFWVKFKYIID